MGLPKRIRISDKFRFECTRCDLCCGTGPNVSITIYDAVRIAEKINVSIDDFLRFYVKVIIADMIPVMLLPGDMKGRCAFLGFSENGKTYCKIYEARPMKCRLFPIKIFKLSGEELEIDEECPGIGSGPEREVPKELVESYRKELKMHYEILHKLIIEDGLEPIEALRNALNIASYELGKEMRKGFYNAKS